LKSVRSGELVECNTPDADDEVLAAHAPATTVLITAASAEAIRCVARRVHHASVRPGSALVEVSAANLPTNPMLLQETCADLLDAAAGGTLLLHEAARMPSNVQECIIEILSALQNARFPSARVRLIAGTTVSLHDRVAAGAFSARLFYRLNTIHIAVVDAAKLRAEA
jgi:two-component system, NtrC family, C4-dicarboxylate transport response regulator DctD